MMASTRRGFLKAAGADATLRFDLTVEGDRLTGTVRENKSGAKPLPVTFTRAE